MKRFAWLFALPLLFAAGCRTYVGSDDVYKTGKPEVLKKETGRQLKRGVILEVKDGRYILTFAKKTVTIRRKKGYRFGEKVMWRRIIPVFRPDTSRSEITVSCNGKTIANHLSSKGKVTFGIADFPDVAFDGEDTIFDIVHRKWNRRWIIRAAAPFGPMELLCWNILYDDQCDYPTRFQALIRLEPVLGEKRCREYLRELLAGELNIKPIIRSEIDISDAQTAPACKAAPPCNGEIEYALAVNYGHANKTLALRWLRKAAEKGNAVAQFKLGICYYNGDGLPKNPSEAKKLFRKAEKQFREAADRNNAEAQLFLGLIYRHGYGLNKDLPEAVKWFREAAKQGNPEAQSQLAMCYYHGHGVEKNHPKARRWFREAAEQGNPEAQFRLGLLSYHDKAAEWFCKAAEQGHAEAVERLRAMEGGDVRVQITLGLCYYNGRGVKRDISKADELLGKSNIINWLRKVAEDHGRVGDEEFLGKTINWLSQAAKKGNAEAQLILGLCHYNGQSVKKDHMEAVKWFRKAAEQNNAEAQLKLGLCHYNGEGVRKNHKAAKTWLKKAAERGNVNAKILLRSSTVHFHDD